MSQPRKSKIETIVAPVNLPSLEQIAMDVMCLEGNDYEGWSRVRANIAAIARSGSHPASLRDMAQQAVALLSNNAWESNQADASLKKLGELLDAMQKFETNGDAEKLDAVTNDTVDDSLRNEFLSNQEATLQEFESDCLKMESGDLSALPSLKRQLHTWKGEAGILGYCDLAAVMHEVEDALASAQRIPPSIVSDTLLAVKDQLSTYFESKRNETEAKLDCSRSIALLSAFSDRKDSTPPSPVAVPPVVLSEPANESTIPIKEEQIPADVPAAPAATAETTSTGSGNEQVFSLPADMDMEIVGDFLAESAEHFQNAEVSLMNVESNKDDAESINTVFRAFHTIKGVSSFIGITCVTDFAHKAETYLDRARKGQLVLEGTYMDLAFEALDMLKTLVKKLPDAINAGQISVPATYGRILGHLENPPALGTVIKAAPVTETQTVIETAANADAKIVESGAGQSNAHAKNVENENTVKVNTSRLDNLINMVGELVIAQSMVGQDSASLAITDQRYVRNVAQLGKITRSLQELALTMRMVTVKTLFQKMARLVRDLSRKANKDIVFEVYGEDTELDRNVVEAIADPLVHMVRNAADHGVEAPDAREQAGKPRQGRIVLGASHEGGSVVITLSDDGKGLDAEKILKKAVERGLVEPGTQLSEKEMLRLIFLPGFSTAEKITDVSGRGVGMDVVRTNIEALHGSVDIQSQPGKGCKFSIRLPLTLAIIEGMIVRAGHERYILPITAITETLRPLRKDIVTVHGRAEVVNLRGDMVPICRLHSLFAIENAQTSLDEGILVVMESKGKRTALLIDELLGQQQVVIKSLGRMFADATGVSGSAILGDGKISLILDVDGLIKAFSS